jgi:hypothetical protein
MEQTISNRYTISTRSRGDGSEACYVVYYMREIIATFPINNPASPDAHQYAERFVRAMDAYMDGAVERLSRR